jgi:putative Holliday junction resolvase
MENVARILGLDVGNRRIGVAISDELGITAQPVLTLLRKNPRADVRSLARLVRKYNCREIVVGNPLRLTGGKSPQAEKTQKFAQWLADETNERLTTVEAHRILYQAGRHRTEHRRVVDQVAAVLILQDFLDSRGAPANATYHPESGPPSSSQV